MVLDNHVSNCRAQYYELSKIRSIRHTLSILTVNILIFSLNKLDYRNSLLANCSQYFIHKFQKVMCSPACLFIQTRKCEYTTPFLHAVHYLFNQELAKTFQLSAINSILASPLSFFLSCLSTVLIKTSDPHLMIASYPFFLQ